DREVEQAEISFSALRLKPNPNGPDIFRLERAFLADKRPLFQGAGLQGTGNGTAVCMVASSIPTVPLPAPPMRRHASLPNDRLRRGCGPSALCAPMARWRRKQTCSTDKTRRERLTHIALLSAIRGSSRSSSI